MSRAEIQAVVHVLKKRFCNLTAEEVLSLAMDILEAIEKAKP